MGPVLLRVLLGMISCISRGTAFLLCVQFLLLDILAIDTNMRLCFPADKLEVRCFVEVQKERGHKNNCNRNEVSQTINLLGRPTERVRR